MPTYELTLQFETQFSVGQSSAAAFHSTTHRFIPGATLWGALGALWWRSPRANSADFAALFDGDLRTTAAIPPGATLRTAATYICKYQEQAKCKEVLVDEAVWEASGAGVPPRECWICAQPLVSDSGWQQLPATKRRGRVQLEADESAQDGKLFSRDYVSADGQRFVANIETAGPIDWLDGKHLYVGHGRSQDLGRARVTIAPGAPVTTAWPDVPRPMAVHLTSPAIITDRWGASSLELVELEREIRRVAQESISLLPRQRWLRSELITGWHGRSNLPKQPEWALAAGSAMVATGLTLEGWQRLAQGIGWRTAEGYGQLALSDLTPAIRPPQPITEDEWRSMSAALRSSRDWSNIKPRLVAALQALAQGAALTIDDIETATSRIVPANTVGRVPLAAAVRQILSLTPQSLSALAEHLSAPRNQGGWR